MFFLRVFLMSLRSLTVHPLRTVLATLGVIFGVAAVVAAMAILEGMSTRILGGFASMGSNKVFVAPNIERRGGRMVAQFDSLDLDDADAISRCNAVARAMPQISNPGALIKFRSKSTNTNVVGVTEIYDSMNNHEVRDGEFMTASHVQGKSSVVVLGDKVKDELFGGRPAIGEKIKIYGLSGARTFTVIGIFAPKGNVGQSDVDRQVVIPITTAMQKLYGVDNIQAVIAEARSALDADIEAAKNEIAQVLRRRHRIRPGQQDDFQVQAQKDMVERFSEFTNILKVVFYSIAGISLFVGGIGIMNIMLVAVTERTREIGVRMAMGATRSDVLKQFLIEASVVSFCGGAVGAVVGWGMANAIETITRLFETLTTMTSIVIALGMATGTGIVSGIYPAWKASRLDPVEALRYE